MDSWIKQTASAKQDEKRENTLTLASGLTHDDWIDQVLSTESLRKVGYFDPNAVAAAREKLAQPGGGLGRTSLEMGLTAVIATQLWHHLYLGGQLCELPAQRSVA